NKRSLTMHDAIVAQHLSAEHMTDALVPQAYPQKRHGGSETLDDLVGDSRFPRRTRPWRDNNVARLQLFNLLDRDLIVAVDLQINSRIQLPEALHQVVGEGIV